VKRAIARALLAGVACLALGSTAPAAARAALPIEAGSFLAGSFAGEGTGKYAPLGIGAVPDVRAGGHPFLSATSFTFQTHPVGTGSLPEGSAKDIVVKLPPGFVGNPTATPRCSQEALLQQGFCPNDAVVGLAYLPVLAFPWGARPDPAPALWFSVPVYNLEPAFGEPALLGFHISNPSLVTMIHFGLDPARDYAIDATVRNASGLATVYSSKLAIWGTPSAAGHDAWRGFGPIGPAAFSGPGCMQEVTTVDSGPESVGSCDAGIQQRPFITDPTACDGKGVLTTIAVDSWQEPGAFDADGAPLLSDPAWSTAVAEAPPVEGCGSLQFGGPAAPATLKLQPVVRSADTPSGYEAKLNLPYNEDLPGESFANPKGLANPTLRDTTVTLPEGVVVNPSSANGLGACTSAQIGLVSPLGGTPIRFDGQPAQCPNPSKIGTVEVTTPLIEHTLDGSVYLAKQFDNPFRSLLAIYVVIEDPETGTIVKLAGHVEADEATGRLTTTFTENPQLPFTELDLHFFGGSQAALLNPQTCGQKTTTSVLTPSSAPQTPPVTYRDSFPVEGGANGGPCPATEAQQPNAPSFEAGTTFTNAGLYSPFVLKLSREDGSQRLQSLNLSLPPGLTGKLAGIPYCSEAQIAQAESRDKPGDGALEQAGPSCPVASQIGTVTVGAGAGSQPYYAQGKAYLAGPYRGAPISMVNIVPAVAGPFDLGVVTVRTALFVDPETTEITAKTDPLPTILEGIPLDVRSIAVNLDHPGGFTLNPTSCEAMAISGQAISTTGNVAPLQNRFQVGGCAGLQFKPHLELSLKGATKRTGHPALKAVVTYPKHGTYANIARAQVGLPHAEFLDQGNLDKVCTRPVLIAGNCPKTSIYGHAKAWTPLLDDPLKGPVYLVGGFGYKLPALVAELNGQVRILLKGKVDTTRHQGIRNTFEAVPDAPVSRFVLEMKGGKRYGLLTNSENICRKTQRASALFSAQNGASLHVRPKIANGCKHRHAEKHKGHTRQKAG